MEQFVSQDLYGGQSDSVDEARYNIFRLQAVTESALPPTQDSLKLHTLRANYQTAIYRNAL